MLISWFFLWNLNPSLRPKNAVNFAMKALNTSLISLVYKAVVINRTELYVFYDNMSQMSALMHTFLPYFPTISVSICPLVVYFFILLHFFFLSVLDSCRIEIGLTRYPSMLNLSLQGLCANNPSSFCWRKSVAPMSFFLSHCVRLIIAPLLRGGMFCMCTFTNLRHIVNEQVSVAVFVGGLHRAGPFWWLNRAVGQRAALELCSKQIITPYLKTLN